MDPTTILTALTAIDTALNISGKIKSQLSTEEVFELKEKITESRSNLLDAKNQIIDLINDNKELKRKLQFNAEFNRENDCYWLADKAIPYCTRCWDKEKIPVTMKTARTTITCPDCGNTVRRKNYNL